MLRTTAALTRTARNRAAVGGLVILLIVAAGLALTRPSVGAIIFALLAAVVAWLLGYYVARKAGRPRRRWMTASGYLLLALILLAVSLLARGSGSGARRLAVVLALAAGAHFGALALGCWKNRRPARPARESALAHKYLDGLKGLEIGGGAHNPFGLDTWNLDYSPSAETSYKQAELAMLGEALPVDIAGRGEALPFLDASLDFVVASHVLEHFPDPIAALQEWYRVIRPGRYIFMIVPHKERTFDRDRPRTTLAELIARHQTGRCEGEGPHYSVWVTEDVVELVEYLGYRVAEAHDVDDKAGNGFTVIIQKP